MRKKRLFKTLLLFGLAALSLTATAGDKDKSYYPTKGYRGSFGLTWGENFKKSKMNEEAMPMKSYFNLQFSTTHGYQIMPELYVGVGVATQFYSGMFGSRPNRNATFDFGTVTPFVDVRYDICQGRISPYLEGRVGYRCVDLYVEGDVDNDVDFDKLYAVPMFGVRFGHFNVAVSYEWITMGGNMRYQYGNNVFYMTKRFSAIGFHAGFDFGARKKQ